MYIGSIGRPLQNLFYSYLPVHVNKHQGPLQVVAYKKSKFDILGCTVSYNVQVLDYMRLRISEKYKGQCITSRDSRLVINE